MTTPEINGHLVIYFSMKKKRKRKILSRINFSFFRFSISRVFLPLCHFIHKFTTTKQQQHSLSILLLWFRRHFSFHWAFFIRHKIHLLVFFLLSPSSSSLSVGRSVGYSWSLFRQWWWVFFKEISPEKKIYCRYLNSFLFSFLLLLLLLKIQVTSLEYYYRCLMNE